ncbi:hypothetical protein [Kitasatospora herbaricolor]|uniref:hypothetical protein n=1 Tax=Kitasatospora herbaricolor TaxID=68217 RepID=UPI0036DB86CD
MAQSTVPEDPADVDQLRAAGREIRALMREAAAAGARLVQFPEGAIVYPGKHVVAQRPDGSMKPADWSRAEWGVLREEAVAVADLAGELRLWTVFGSLHPLTAPNRPHNSLSAPRGAVPYSPHSGQRLEERSLDLMAYPRSER